MKIFFIVFLFTTLSSYAAISKNPQLDTTPQTEVIPKAAPGASTPALENTQPEIQTDVQKQEQTAIENDYPIGDYNQKGEYIFFDRLEREKEEAAKEAEQQNQ